MPKTVFKNVTYVVGKRLMYSS